MNQSSEEKFFIKFLILHHHPKDVIPFSSLWPIELSAKYMHLVTVMKHKKYKTRVISSTKRDLWFFFGILLYLATVFIALIAVLSEEPVVHYPW